MTADSKTEIYLPLLFMAMESSIMPEPDTDFNNNRQEYLLLIALKNTDDRK